MYEQKNCPSYFLICKYTFLNIWKGGKQKIVVGILRFASIIFKIFEKGDKQKIGPGGFKICKYSFLII